MDFHFLVMEKSWKIDVEKEGHRHPGSVRKLRHAQTQQSKLKFQGILD